MPPAFIHVSYPLVNPVKGSVATVIEESHLTFVIPYQPGTTRRSGKPCCGGRGAAFIS